jgi:polysaccharide export outer membrane protein
MATSWISLPGKRTDFSREEIIVRLDGNISFPLLDDIVAAGKTPTQLKAGHRSFGLKEFVAEPNVTVSGAKMRPASDSTSGRGVNTGEYPLVNKT